LFSIADIPKIADKYKTYIRQISEKKKKEKKTVRSIVSTGIRCAIKGATSFSSQEKPEIYVT